MKKTLVRAQRYWLFCLFILLTKTYVMAQCGGCTTTYASNYPLSINVNAGSTVCINAGVTMSGQVTLNGGVICNKGTISKLKVHGGKGIIFNYGVIKDVETAITFAGNLSVFSYSASTFDWSGSSFNTSSMDSLFFMIYNGGKVSFLSDLPITSKKLSVYNGMTDPAAPTYTGASYFNVGNDLSVDGAKLKLYNSQTGIVNITRAVNLSNTTDKAINNYGIFNVNGDLNIGGNGGTGSTSILVENSNNMYVMGSIKANIVHANFNLNNLSSTSGPGLTVDTDIQLTELTHTFINSASLNVGNSIDLSGIMVNNETVHAHNNFTVHTSFTNNYLIQINDLVITSTAVVNNRGVIDASHDFNNSGKLKLNTKALLKTVNFYNIGSDSIIGPSPVGLDTANYPRIWIKSFSKNIGYVHGAVLLSDETLTANVSSHGTGFDVVITPTNLGPYVFWVYTADGTGVFPNTSIKGKFYYGAIASTYNIACGAPNSVTLTANPGVPYYSITHGNGVYSLEYPVYTWQPGSLTGQSVVVNPTSTTTYTVSFTTSMASYIYTVTVNVAVVIASCGGPTINFSMPDDVTLSGGLTGGTAPYTYNWSPNAFFTSGTATSQNPHVTPLSSVCYTLTVTDALGCHANCEVCVIAQPYAHFNKLPDGGYYKLFNNKLLFKYDGQYAQTNLSCAILDKKNNPISYGSFSSIVVNSGDNRYYYDANLLPVGYYTMEITNEKNEKLYLRFKR